MSTSRPIRIVDDSSMARFRTGPIPPPTYRRAVAMNGGQTLAEYRRAPPDVLREDRQPCLQA